MKNYKKIGLLTGLLLLGVFYLAGAAPHALASAPPAVKLGSDFKFTDNQHITGTINGNTVTFLDSVPTDGTRNFQPQGMADPPWCNYKTSGNQRWGINIPSGADLTGSSVSGTIGLGYENTLGNNTSCDQIPATSISPSSTIKIDTSSAAATLTWQGNNIVSSDGSQTYQSTNVSTIFINQSNAGSCESSGIVKTSGPNSGTIYFLGNGVAIGGKGGGSGAPGTAVPSSISSYLNNPGACHLLSTQKASISGTQGQGAGTACIGGSNCQNGVCTNTAGDCTAGPTQTTCEANSDGFSFAWAVCPVMDAASKLTDTLLGYFEDQLSFTVGQLGSSSDANSGNYKVHHSWSIIKDIASSLVVIIMLIMVLSQAASFGPFDAYTIRKLLPRLVAVVILMQISWSLFAYTIVLVNDVARGIADIMYLPFGGADNMNLFALLANAHLGGVELGVLNWAAIGVGVALGIAFLFTMLGVAFTAIVALFFAFLTLVFRKILIIILLIFSPLALLAWILPGTERYWKMWRENFFKALFMFPILVAIIAAGRVFAYVVGTENNGEFLNLIFILVGFFGPLFLAPRTFKWGGQAMQLAGNGIMKASTKVSERPKKLLDARQEGWSAERKRQSQERYAHDTRFNLKAPWRRPIDLIRSGQIDPTLTGRRKQQAMDSYVFKGVESEEADIKAANSRAQLVIDRLSPTNGDQDIYARELAAGRKARLDEHGNILGERRADGSLDQNADGSYKLTNAIAANDVEMRAGLEQVNRLGGDGNMEWIQSIHENVMASGDRHQIETINKFMTANAGTLFSKLPHLYKNSDYMATRSFDATISGLGAADMTKVSARGINRMVDLLSAKVNDPAVPAADKQGARAQLSRLFSVYHQALMDPNLAGNIPPDLSRRMKLLSNTTIPALIASYTPPPVVPGAPVPADPLLRLEVAGPTGASILDDMDIHIDDDGVTH